MYRDDEHDPRNNRMRASRCRLKTLRLAGGSALAPASCCVAAPLRGKQHSRRFTRSLLKPGGAAVAVSGQRRNIEVMVKTARLLVAMLLLFGIVLDSPSVAKEGIRARLVAPIAKDASEGATLKVGWTLRTEDGGPLGASGFFVRLTGSPGSKPQEADAVESGTKLLASVVVPPGGIEKVEIGLRGWRQMEKDGPSEPADVFFPIDGQIFRQSADAPIRWPFLLSTIPAAGMFWWLRRLKLRRDASPRTA